MVKEAKDPKYLRDGFFLRHFNRFPLGCDFDRLIDVQKDFIMYLMGCSPSVESVSVHLNYLREYEMLEKKDYIKDFILDDMVLTITAKSQNKTLEEYKTEITESMKRDAIRELNQKYGIKDNGE